MKKHTITFTAEIYSIDDIDVDLNDLSTMFQDVVNRINYYDQPLCYKPKVLVGKCRTVMLSDKDTE